MQNIFHYAICTVLLSLTPALAQDASRLLDLCRQSIVFENIANLATCLRTIEADPDVHILRIKNRLDPSYDSLTTAGYRDVELNMLIVNQATEDLGISTHVCEMQLIHQPFAELKVMQVLTPFYL